MIPAREIGWILGDALAIILILYIGSSAGKQAKKNIKRIDKLNKNNHNGTITKPEVKE